MINRRQFFGSLAGAAALIGLPGLSVAQGVSGRRFVFIFAQGGWDPLTVFAPLFGSPSIDMEPDAEPMRIGNFNLVDHPSRPSVRRFFETWGEATTVFNGISTRSVAHDVCTYVAMTGSSSGSESDWPSLIAHAELARYSMPSLVISGPTLPGNREVAVARAGEGLLGALVSGDIAYYAENSGGGPNARAGLLLDRFVSRRAAQNTLTMKTLRGQSLAADLDTSLRQSVQLKRLQGTLPFEAYDLDARINMAVAALAQGVSRTVTLSDDGMWDTHEDNSPQSPQFDTLFSGITGLLEQLTNTPGPSGDPLIDDTLVVVLSEMGRTPRYNRDRGRDHWPYTSAMIIGNTPSGGREIGAYDQQFSGVGVDPASGDLVPESLGVSAEDFGATLLALADVDPAPLLPNATPIAGMLR